MRTAITGIQIRFRLVLLFSAFLTFLSISTVWGHGGKTHEETKFSSFEAIQKASVLYDKLLKMDKLPEEWETALKSIHVKSQQSNGKSETIVQFVRSKGKPDSVFFFFNENGDYSGSNFTGP